MGLALGGVIANWFGVLIIYINLSYRYSSYSIFLLIAIIFALISTIGLILAALDKKIGGVLIIIGSVFFVPLGLIGVFGGKNVLKEMNEYAVEQKNKIIE